LSTTSPDLTTHAASVKRPHQTSPDTPGPPWRPPVKPRSERRLDQPCESVGDSCVSSRDQSQPITTERQAGWRP
jgi:hypothetical protein